MGELLLCHETIAALPYYIEEIGINIYSMEELSYYISGNVYLLDHSFMCESLCTWVEKQMHRVELAQKLRENIRTEGKLSDFVFAILQDTAYCTMKEMQEIVFAVRQMEQKSDFERDKIRADQLMEKEKYLAAIYRYKHLLDEADMKETSEVLRGNLWHNLGTAYARLFLFEEAGRCFEKAYALQTDMNLPASEILSTYVYRIGLLNGDYGYSTAVGLFNSVVNVILLIFVNWVVKKLNDGEGL